MEDFVPFEIAKKLKEKEFNSPCIGHYLNDKLYIAHYLNEFHSNDDRSIDAPTISQVLKWLREEKKIFVKSGISYDTSEDADGNVVDRWTFWLFEIFSTGDGSLIYVEEICEYDTYELAALAGIEYVIDNLI